MLTTIYLLLALVGNWTCHVATLMIENGRFGRAKVKNELELRKESFLAKSVGWKPLLFSKDLAGKFNLLHTRRTLAL